MSGLGDGAGDAVSGLMLGWVVVRAVNRAPRRIAAFLMDYALIAVLAWTAERFVDVPAPFQATMLFVPYRIASQALFQATIAKRLFGLRVVYNERGLPFSRVVLRESPLVVLVLWVPVVSVLPVSLSVTAGAMMALAAITAISAWALTDVLVMAESPAGESSLHDRIAGTRVIRIPVETARS